jgi:DNA-dependent metalloprotease WSS1
MSDNLVLSYVYLKDRPRALEALNLLRRVASLVKPIMQKRSWSLPELAEFFPENNDLVGTFYPK